MLKINARLMNPEWKPREKDYADIAVLEGLLGEDVDEIRKRVWSHNPFWYVRGYEEYYFPIVLDRGKED